MRIISNKAIWNHTIAATRRTNGNSGRRRRAIDDDEDVRQKERKKKRNRQIDEDGKAITQKEGEWRKECGSF